VKYIRGNIHTHMHTHTHTHIYMIYVYVYVNAYMYMCTVQCTMPVQVLALVDTLELQGT
jgi:hypothetical protein